MRVRKHSHRKHLALSHLTSQSINSRFGSVIYLFNHEFLIGRHRIDDLQRRIAMQDWESADADIRSPSPEPVYDPKTGLRMNTKEQRYKDKYVRERNALIAEVLVIDPTYMAPPDYKPPKKYKRLYIPDPDNPSINYIGQIIGPGGTTQ
jgi:splicing factor 1